MASRLESRRRIHDEDLHHDLEPIEASSLSCLDFIAEALDEVLIDNTIGRSEKSEDMRDEVTLVVVQSVVPIVEILRQIHLLGSPERRFSLLIHLPNLSTETSASYL